MITFNKTRENPTVLVLGGGLGKRMGGPKLFTLHKGRYFANYIDDTCTKQTLNTIWVLSEATQKEKLEQILHHPVVSVVNPLNQGDMLSSVIAGVRNSQTSPGTPFIIWPVDFPFVSTSTLEKTIEHFRYTDISQPCFDNKKGHPFLISERVISLAISEQLTDGLRGFFKKSRFRTVNFSCNDPNILRNINYPSDL